MRTGHGQRSSRVKYWWQSSHLNSATCGFSLLLCPWHVSRLLEPNPTFPLGQQELVKCRRIVYNIKRGTASGSPCWCRHRVWQLRGKKKDHSGQKITEGSGETAHCFKSNAVEQASLPICRAETPLITEAFLGSLVGLFVKHSCKVNMKKKCLFCQNEKALKFGRH